jgi:membrane peptidoglycan carboxypeptidase
MTKVLQPGGTAYGHALSGRPSAGKTGTTDRNTNAWFTGFTPQLCMSVWIGNVNRNKTIAAGGVGEVFGGTLPAEIWQSAMDAALLGAPVEQFPAPAPIGLPQNQTTTSPSPTASATATSSPSPTVTETVAPPPTPTATVTIPPTHSSSPTPSPTPSPTSSALAGPSSSPGHLERQRRALR